MSRKLEVTSHKVRRRSYGRTLIELIIAMAIGLVILIGVGTLYMSSSGVSRVATQLGTAEDTGRVVMHLIGIGLKAGGYGEIIGSDYSARSQTLFDGPAVRGCSNSRLLDPFNPTTPDYNCGAVVPGSGDQVLFRFQGRHSIAQMSDPQRDAAALPDCIGASNANQDLTINSATPRPGIGTQRRLVESVFALDAAQNELECVGNGNPGVSEVIVSDVVDFTVFYRFDNAGYDLSLGSSTNYSPVGGTILSAASINLLAGEPWNHVVAAIVCITVASREQGTSIETAGQVSRCARTQAEAQAGTPLTEASPNGAIRRTFTEVLTVRSLATGSPSIAL